MGGLPGARPRLNQIDLVTQIMTGGNQNVEINIFGESLGELSRLSRDVMGRVRDVSGYENVDVNWQDATPELQWKVDRQKATQLGLTFQEVAATIGTATRGTIASYYQENGFQYPILVQLPETRRKTVDDLLALPLRPTTSLTAAATNTPTGAAVRA